MIGLIVTLLAGVARVCFRVSPMRSDAIGPSSRQIERGLDSARCREAALSRALTERGPPEYLVAV